MIENETNCVLKSNVGNDQILDLLNIFHINRYF